MEATKFIIAICCLLFVTNCRNNRQQVSTAVNKDEAEYICSAEISKNQIPIDSVEVQIDQIIREVFDKYGQRIEFEASDNSSYIYVIKELHDTSLRLIINRFPSEEAAQSELLSWQQERKRILLEEKGFKIINFSLRFGNKIYSISSTENISHIRGEVFERIKVRYEVPDNNISFL